MDKTETTTTLTEDQMNVVKSIVSEALKPLGAQVAEIATSVVDVTKSVGTLTENVAALEINSGDTKTADADADAKKGDDATAESFGKAEVAALIADALKERDEKAAAATGHSEAVTAYIEKHAPKLKGNPLAVQLLMRADNTDEARKAALDGYVESVKLLGVDKLPDLGTATPETDGGTTGTADASKEQAEEAAKLTAIDNAHQSRAAI